MAKVRIKRADYDITVLCNHLAEATQKPALYTTEPIENSTDEWFNFINHSEAEVQTAIELYLAGAPARQAAIERETILDALAASDEGMIRTIEDILDAIVAAGLIQKSYIPKPVLDKIEARKALREQLSAV